MLRTTTYVIVLFSLVYRAFASLYWEGRRAWRLNYRVTRQQVYFTAVQSLPLTVFVAVAMGALLMHQASVVLRIWGAADLAEWLTVLVLFKEFAPLTVALVIIARSANAIVIELGNMKVNGEIRALDVLGVNIDRFVILPRLIGMVVSVVLLTIIFCGAGLWGGFYIAKWFGLLESDFLFLTLQANFTPAILINIILRAFCFGMVISSVACHHGLSVQVSPVEVPQQASQGVVRALSLCFVLNFLISVYVPTDFEL